MTDLEKNEILSFLHVQPMAVIATNSISSAAPESALIAFVERADFTILFETFSISRKYENLKSNPHVSLVTGLNPEALITFQYEGIAQPVNKSMTESAIQEFAQKDTPCSETFLRDPRVKLFEIKPTWFRYSDYRTQVEPRIIEFNF